MPWSVGDVDEHKKGLSDTQKARWVAIANSVLKKCMADGGSEKSCAASAIRQANGVVGNEAFEGYNIYKKIQQEASYAIRTKKHQGRTHLIVPVVMMVEGVHHGSHGPLLHQIEDLGKFPESWNGIPIVIDHPEIDGINVSANSPDIIDAQTVGRVYNTYVKDTKKLAAEAWLDEEKLQNLSKKVLDQIKAGKPLEVSLGVFTEEELVTGEWNGEHYEAIAKNHRPDHLALLPGSVGACSLEDGCGLGVNKEEETPPIESSINLITKEVNTMAENTCLPCIKKKVDELIANSQGKYTEDDRVMLEALNESLLDRIAQPVIQEKEVIKEVDKVIEVNVLSDEDKADLEAYRAQKKAEREELVKTIQDNLGKEVWTDDVLGKMETSFLKKVAEQYIKKEQPVDYSLNGGNGFQTNKKVEPLAPTGIVFKNQ